MPEQVVDREVFHHQFYQGSVKNILGQAQSAKYVFEFSDRYSIFDWGEMPDSLPGKGEALAIMGDLLFRFLADPKTWSEWHISEKYPKFWRDSLMSSPWWSRLRRSGLPHHSLGLVDSNGQALDPGSASKYLAVKACDRAPVSSNVENGKVVWDYSAYAQSPSSAFVPLEIVFRFGAPEGSSFLGRMKSDPSYASSFGFVDPPRAGEWFPYPIVEFFTKFEPTDRFLSIEEAKQIAGLSKDEFDSLVTINLLVALRLKDFFASIGLELWDGKFEFAFLEGSPRGFLLVDAIGPDELRLLGAGGVHFSKEYLRRVYRGSPWYNAVEKAKKLASDRGVKDWKNICRAELQQVPAPLDNETLTLAKEMYPLLAEVIAAKVLGHNPRASLEDFCRKLEHR